MPHRPKIVLLGAVALAPLALVTSEPPRDIYRYVDDDGVIHFSNTNKRGKLVIRSGEARSPKRVQDVRESDPDRDPARYDAYIREAASLYQIPEALVRAVIRVESNFDPNAISHANAR